MSKNKADEKKIPYVAVYTGSSERVDSSFPEVAKEVGQAIAHNGFGLVYGGGRMGLMGKVATQAIEYGAPVVGVSTKHLDDIEGAQQGLTELHVTDHMHARKLMMFKRSDGFMILPGGYGTLDEFFETLVWRQIQLHKKPIVLLNFNNYWDPLITLLEHIIDTKFARSDQRNDFIVCDNIADAMKAFRMHFDDTFGK